MGKIIEFEGHSKLSRELNLELGSLLTIIGKPGSGKTVFATWLSAMLAKQKRRETLKINYVSSETRKEDIAASWAYNTTGGNTEVTVPEGLTITEARTNLSIDSVGKSISKMKLNLSETDVLVLDILEGVLSKKYLDYLKVLAAINNVLLIVVMHEYNRGRADSEEHDKSIKLELDYNQQSPRITATVNKSKFDFIVIKKHAALVPIF